MLFFGAILFQNAFGGNIYPNSYTLLEKYEGGEVYAGENKSGKPVSFLIKPSWTGETESIFIWEGFPKLKSLGFSLHESNILASIVLHGNLYILWQEQGRFFAGIIAPDAQLLSKLELPRVLFGSGFVDAEWCMSTGDSEVLAIVQGNLFKFQLNDSKFTGFELIARNVVCASFARNSSQGDSSDILFVTRRNDYSSINIKTKESVKTFAVIPSSGKVRLQEATGGAVLVCEAANSSSIIYLVDTKNGFVTNYWVKAKPNLLEFSNDESGCVFFLRDDNCLVKTKLANIGIQSEWSIVELSKRLSDPKALKFIDGNLFVLFQNGLATLSKELTVESSDFIQFGSEPHLRHITKIDDVLVVSGKNGSFALIRESNPLWFFYRFYYNIGDILLPAVLVLLLIITIQIYRHEKRYLKAIMALPSSGFVFILDKRGRLRLSNPSGMQLLNIQPSTPLKKPFQRYCVDETLEPLRDFVDNALIGRISASSQITLNKDNQVNEYLCTAVTLTNLTGQFRGLVLTGIDITEELGRKQLSNWAQLAHDMQTNLSTIKLNTELIDVEGNDENHKRRQKILHQVNVLIQRVRDIVTVGRGEKPEMLPVSASDICAEVVSEFDASMFPNIALNVDSDSFMLDCDKPKIVRALRNAVENAIRAFDGNKGVIIIQSRKDSRFAYFIVNDNGSGMDETTKSKMLTPYFSTSKKHGGSGIGTMIMQHVVELHKGRLIVNSEVGKGTEITFVIPLNNK